MAVRPQRNRLVVAQRIALPVGPNDLGHVAGAQVFERVAEPENSLALTRSRREVRLGLGGIHGLGGWLEDNVCLVQDFVLPWLDFPGLPGRWLRRLVRPLDPRDRQPNSLVWGSRESDVAAGQNREIKKLMSGRRADGPRPGLQHLDEVRLELDRRPWLGRTPSVERLGNNGLDIAVCDDDAVGGWVKGQPAMEREAGLCGRASLDGDAQVFLVLNHGKFSEGAGLGGVQLNARLPG